MEYRYWMYLEEHPAHAPIPPHTHQEAMNALSWSYTESLLPSSRPVAPPFAPQECQELMGLLRSADGSVGTSSVVQARIVARVMLRMAQWRQQVIRPDRPLPQDVNRPVQRPSRFRQFVKFILEVIVSCLCLGIPYFFIGRAHRQRTDEESGVPGSGTMLVISGCACLMAAIILSASVTFVSLVGLDEMSRLAGLVAILFSASSMVSAVIALFRYKSELEHTVEHVGGEGLIFLSRRSIVMSIPLVFLAWAVAAFITGITYYTLRGNTATGRVVMKYPHETYTHWTVVGGTGGLAGMVIMSALLCCP
ncbi:uncharacterized protein LAESUDRAFT_653443 [Laetiporus sulphureus 93-53]|uniref:Uncharacterized protein n=1 Tax=Laetiporus sulphureus 93-53 TaxID=1314785 RepID=A0A165E8C2_9APHY|nr:uncharacterized protein LAESUDRAFT_653443 [Laetiporus sulphureus 93-53]KZT06446.1 hypothetical protein LAESUDRAFT_653443 [Laetiporus sulphureus 93-53]